MSSRLRLWHIWEAQVRALLPQLRVTRARVLALFVLGTLWAGQLTLLRVAAALPLSVADVSTERRLQRFLANRAVVVSEVWAALLPALLAGQVGREVSLVFDPTPHQDRATIVVLGVVAHKRVLPVAWRVVPQREPWPEELLVVARALIQAVAAALPPGCVVTLLADRGLTSPALMALCREMGWHYVLRLNVSAATSNRVIIDGRERALWDLVRGPGQRWTGTVPVFKKAGWRVVELTIWWDRGAAEPWVLVSDRPAGAARVREYRRRARAAATYQDCKRRGWDIERTKVTALDHLDRLLLVLHLAVWWAPQLGLRAGSLSPGSLSPGSLSPGSLSPGSAAASIGPIAAI